MLTAMTEDDRAIVLLTECAMADQRRDPDQRSSPEALLEAARREEAGVGKLKIFVGAAPGQLAPHGASRAQGGVCRAALELRLLKKA